MKGNRFFKTIRFNIIIFLASLLFLNNAFSAEPILYVSDGGFDPPNWDIYSMNSDGTGVTRLTDSPSIDNHPVLSPDGTTVAFSSDLIGSNFEIYTAPLGTLSDEGTWTQLTSFGCNNSTNTSRCTPARHPHWSPDGSHIIYTANDGCCCSSEPVVSHCSVPVKILDPCCTDSGKETEHYERIHVMGSDGKGDITIDLIELGLELGPSSCDAPQIFHGGHPSFNPAGNKIIFTGATNRDGTVWDVFVTGWDGTKASGLTQVTKGTSYPPSLNPISMSGGAAFANEGKDILFSSTRLPKGNSQIFRINDWAGQTLPKAPGDDIRLTFHCGNDYVPYELDNIGGPEMIVYNSDASTPGQPWSNPTDQDIWIMDGDGSTRTNLTNTPTLLEVLLLADEVSWFCGLPRNLSPCHFIPRIYSLESFYLMRWSDFESLPPTFPNLALYSVYTNALFTWKQAHVPNYIENINLMLDQFFANSACLSDNGPCPEAIQNLTLPTFMPETPGWCPDCVECGDCLLIDTPGPAVSVLQGGNVGDTYSQTFTVNGGNTPISWQIFAGQLPPGLSLNQSTGKISGTPTKPGTFVFSIAASDAIGNADSVDDTITVIDTAINTSPKAAITSPSNGSTFTQGSSVTFSGTGSDTEDGTLSSNSLVWTSSLDGQIGTGTSFASSGLSVGTHTITLTATDSESATGTDTLSITVGTQTTAPTPDIKANGSDGPVTPTGNLSVTVALDPGSSSGDNADWWVAADTPFGWFYYNRALGWVLVGGPSGLLTTHQGPLFNLSPPFEVLNMSGLTSGTYTFYFAVDWVVNGVLDLGSIVLDSVIVVVP